MLARLAQERDDGVSDDVIAPVLRAMRDELRAQGADWVSEGLVSDALGDIEPYEPDVAADVPPARPNLDTFGYVPLPAAPFPELTAGFHEETDGKPTPLRDGPLGTSAIRPTQSRPGPATADD